MDPFSAVTAGITALYGPLHGGANEAVLRMLRQIGHVSKVPEFIKQVKGGEDTRLMGFGHRVYKNYDPRAKVIKRMADQVFEVTGRNPLLDIALELERIALQDDYFVKRRLYPNVDFYFRAHLRGDGLPGGDVPCVVRDPTHGGMGDAVGRDDHRQRAEDCAAAADLHRLQATSISSR